MLKQEIDESLAQELCGAFSASNEAFQKFFDAFKATTESWINLQKQTIALQLGVATGKALLYENKVSSSSFLFRWFWKWKHKKAVKSVNHYTELLNKIQEFQET